MQDFGASKSTTTYNIIQNLESKVAIQSTNSLAAGPDSIGLKNENERLKKELMILETELRRFKIHREK